MQDLKVIVKEIQGYCDTIQEGDYFIVRGGQISIPEGHFCYWALNSILPLLPAKQRKLDEKGDWMEGTWIVRCPDPNGGVMMEMVPIPSKDPI
jgi:carbon-monoxide dehydrogenase iron sulfur subunit